MPWPDYSSPRRLSAGAIDHAAKWSLELLSLSREFLLEHARDHVKRTGSLECPTCARAAVVLPVAKEAIGPLVW